LKFIYADSLDYVDPDYDFLNDEFSKGREPYWGDRFAHELMASPPYDGLLVTRALLGGKGVSGKYTEAQTMRFLRVGAREFFRLNPEAHANLLLFGDCGAFSYHAMKEPPYSPAEMIEFYQSAQFTHGVSVDHIVFEFGKDKEGSAEARRRTELTLDMANEFISEHRMQQASFTPIGAVQGWSPESLARSASALIDMGYRYLAIGGLVPLRIDAIAKAVSAVDEATANCPDARIHLLGFAKAEHIHLFRNTKVASFDSASPMIRAFKDNTKNYWSFNTGGQLTFYQAIRIPQADENNKLKRQIKRGVIRQEELRESEQAALSALRRFDRDEIQAEAAVTSVMEYSRFFLDAEASTAEQRVRKETGLRQAYLQTLKDQPWKHCRCEICTDCGVEVMIFRASNRNKRRGIHNLHSFHAYVDQLNREAA
jgi:hypothetical protein